ncbi:S9 family peptidase [Novosphingobium sp. P6W]|uniref:alpha/beta hydrolase family protein n=1 Tax=Novosphingobium sp. P6W TaxID=1609758 RepID=UPI0005C2C0CE|nr:alpha/beta fold hydrolase [Novosphingobium sp. P6W]AXB76797.1 S9 family peptidase [Novosphingobium sp. P6W]KIS33349.1 peptidase S9 [Novosphingobium sp. P6W]
MGKLFTAASSLAIALWCAGAANAEDAAQVAAAFGEREAVSDISLSPGGTMIAFVQPYKGRGDVVTLVDFAKGGQARPILTVTRPGERVGHCSWPTDDQLICIIGITSNATGQIVRFNRQIVIGVDGSPAKILTPSETNRALGFTWYGGDVIDWQGKNPGEVLMLRQFVPENGTGTRMASTAEGLGVESVNVRTLRRTIYERPVANATTFIGDGRGSIRIMGINPSYGNGYDKSFIDYSYRKQGERGWSSLNRVVFNPSGTVSGFNPVAVDPDLDAVYGFENKDGFAALYRMKLDGSDARELVFAKPGIDIDGLVQVGRSRRVVGASFASEYRQVELFDPALKALRQSLSKAFKPESSLSFLDASADENRLLLFTGSDIDPGRYYMFDRATRKLEEIVPVRPGIAGRTLARMKPVQYPAADGTMIPAYLTLPPGSDGKNLPAIVMPHGGPSSRDEWGFDWLVQFYAARGFAVLQPNFRGSAGFGEAWFEKNGFQSWRTAIGDVDAAGRWLVSTGVAANDKLAILGWSYGGYAALQSGVLDPGLFKAIVAIAPVTDLAKMRNDKLHYSNFVQVDAMIGNGAHVTEGSPAQNASSIAVPVLMFHGDLDLNVDVTQSRLMESRLRSAGKSVELVTFSGLSHSLVDGDARTTLLSRSDAFLRKSLNLPTN